MAFAGGRTRRLASPRCTNFRMRTNSVINSANAKLSRWTPSVALALVLFFVPAMAAAQTLVQQASNAFDPNNPNLGSVNVSFTNSETVGNLTVVVVGWGDTSSTVASVTDDGGNTFRLAAGTNTSACCSQTIYFAVVTTAAKKITVNFNQVASAPDVRIREYSGLDATQPLDASAGQPGSSGSSGATADSGSATTSNATDLIVGAGTISSFFTAGGSGFGNVVITAHFSDIIEDKNVATAGSHNATATAAAGNWAMQMAAFSTATVTSLTPTFAAISPASGPDTGGTAVAITGTNFAPGAVVLFDGVSAVNCALKSSTEIDCSTPTHGVGTATVTVQNVDGQSASSAGAFTYTTSQPVISNVAFTAGQNTTNGGNQVTITGSSFEGPATVKIGGLPASNVTVVNSTEITASAPAHAVGAADVFVKNADGGNTTSTGAYSYVMGTGPVNFVQGAGSGASSGTHSSWPVTLPNAQTAGDLTVVIVGWSNSSSVSSVTDDGGNQYVLAIGPLTNAGGNISQSIYYAKNIKSSTTITANFSSAAGAPDVRVLEYSGLDPANPLDTNTAAAAEAIGSGTQADSGAITTTFANNVIVAGAMVGQTVLGAGNNFAINEVTNDGNGAAHQINSSAVGSVHAVMNQVSSAWLIQAVSFHASPAVAQPSFALSASPTSASVNAGSSATFSISATGQNLTSAISLACTAPSGVGIACSVSPSSITPGGSPATLTVTTTGPTAALIAPHRNSLLPLYAIWLPVPGMALAGIGYASRKRKLAIGMTLFLVLGLALLLAGCGGGGSSSGGGGGGGGGGGTGGTTPGNYTITVTGTSGSLSHQTQVTLTVN